MKITIDRYWYSFFERYYLLNSLVYNINTIYNTNDTVYPHVENVLNAFKYTKRLDIKCIIIGQDPYINEKNNIPEAMGLSFSIDKSIKVLPPTLRNIFKNLIKFGHIEKEPENGDLTRWAKQGVLLLNSSLTTIKGKSNAHASHWTYITDKIIEEISSETDNLVFILLGQKAISKEKIICKYNHHKIIKASHPSPHSYNKTSKNVEAFINVDVFGECNKFLKKNAIKW